MADADTAAAAGPEAARADLVDAVFDGRYRRVHEDIRALLADAVFDPCEGLAPDAAGRLAYDRARFVHRALERPRAILADPERLFALAEWPALLDVSLFSLLMVHYNLCLGTVLEHSGDSPDLDGPVSELDDLTSFGVFMATELGYGNNVAALKTEAVYDPETETFELRTPGPPAQKFMSYSGFQDVPKQAVVMARLKTADRDWGVFPFLVRISTEKGLEPGVHAAPCPQKPVQGLDNGVTWFDGVRVPRSALLGGELGRLDADGTLHPAAGNERRRFLRAMSRIVPGRLCVASSAVGAGRASVYIALRYAEHRLTNAPGRAGIPIIEYRSHQLALFTALAKAYAMTFLVNHAKREYLAHEGPADGALDALISTAKALATWEMTEVVAVCRERCGAQGMFSVNRIADYGSLLQGLVTAEGDNQVLLATTAGQTLARPEPEPERQDAGADAPSARGRDIQDSGFHAELLGFRERRLRREAREAVADDGKPYFDSWNDTMNGALASARLTGVRIAVERFRAAAEAAAEPDSRTALALLAALYGLAEVQRDAGWYLAHGALDASQVLELPGRMDALCGLLRPYVPLLIEGFALTPELLRAPIAADDYVAAFQQTAGAEPGKE